VSKLFSGDFNSSIFELTRVILAHFVRLGTARTQLLPARARSPASRRLAGARSPAGPGLAPPLHSGLRQVQTWLHRSTFDRIIIKRKHSYFYGL